MKTGKAPHHMWVRGVSCRVAWPASCASRRRSDLPAVPVLGQVPGPVRVPEQGPGPVLLAEQVPVQVPLAEQVPEPEQVLG